MHHQEGGLTAMLFLTLLLFVHPWTGQHAPIVHREPAQNAAQSTVQPLDSLTLAKLIAQRNDRPLLLNVWATWCVPCVEEFPDLEQVYKAYGSTDLDVAVISIDFEDEVRSKVLPFLRKTRATMPAYINAFPRQTDLIAALDPDWSGAVPATFIFSREGRLVKSVIGKQSFEQFELLTAPVRARSGEERPPE